jgi:hypothetical protein
VSTWQTEAISLSLACAFLLSVAGCKSSKKEPSMDNSAVERGVYEKQVVEPLSLEFDIVSAAPSARTTVRQYQ